MNTQVKNGVFLLFTILITGMIISCSRNEISLPEVLNAEGDQISIRSVEIVNANYTRTTSGGVTNAVTIHAVENQNNGNIVGRITWDPDVNDEEPAYELEIYCVEVWEIGCYPTCTSLYGAVVAGSIVLANGDEMYVFFSLNDGGNIGPDGAQDPYMISIPYLCSTIQNIPTEGGDVNGVIVLKPL